MLLNRNIQEYFPVLRARIPQNSVHFFRIQLAIDRMVEQEEVLLWLDLPPSFHTAVLWTDYRLAGLEFYGQVLLQDIHAYK